MAFSTPVRACASSARNVHRVLCFPGDGVGPELMQAAQHVLHATGVPIEYESMDYGQNLWERTGQSITEAHLEAFERVGCLLKGPIEIQSGKGYAEIRGKKFTSANQVLRKEFELFANVRPAKHLAGSGGRYAGTDVVVVRENTEGAYTGDEEWIDQDTVVTKKRVTRAASLRIARFAFEYARRFGRSTVTAVHKANVHKQADGLFLDCCRQVAKDFNDIEYKEQLADSMCTTLVMDPTSCDVLVTENLFGDLLSDLAAGLIGGLGMAPSGQYGLKYAMFEPCHGSAPDIAGKGIVNPCSLLLSAAMMLDFLGEKEAAVMVQRSVEAVVGEGKFTTPDLGGTSSTQEMAAAVAWHVEKLRTQAVAQGPRAAL
eukprot:TRINITY_DN26874_c0_g1_i1.p1 TRINITY_DN26874_c0_g1~~TRINITY_DN26874_c0_g1_i1.p1  ORF type:complete len:410 (-),score=49.74 TRINITY_DN26874_c0_g1_i1:362-1477(-)